MKTGIFLYRQTCSAAKTHCNTVQMRFNNGSYKLIIKAISIHACIVSRNIDFALDSFYNKSTYAYKSQAEQGCIVRRNT